MAKRPASTRSRDLAASVFAALTSVVVAIYLELFREEARLFHTGADIALLNLSFTPGAVACMIAAFAVTFALLMFLNKQRRILSFLFKWRYPLAAVLLVVLVALQVSGSSLALWGNLLDDVPYSDLEGVLFGIPRTIRTDEYVVFTPLAFSQEHAGYAAVADLARSVPTDLTLVYAQPCWDVATLFRPFFWGYLIMGSAFGLSFFWCGRLIVLFLVSFEFGRNLTRDNRPFALFYAVSISLAPITQWWFSVNGTAELLIFAQGGILAFARFLRATTRSRRIAWSSIAAYSAGCFVMIVYPAWQVSIAYFIVAFCIAEIVRCRQDDAGALSRSIGARSAFVSYWLALLCALAVVVALIAVSFANSMDVVRAVSNTEYPGNRISTGGGLWPLLFDWVCSWVYPLYYQFILPNACERAEMFSLFPLGIILSIVSLRYRRDPRVIALLVTEAVLLVYGIVGFPDWLARITLLSNVPSSRLVFALGLCDMVLLTLGAMACLERPRRDTAPHAAPSYAGNLKLALASVVFAAAVTALSLGVCHPELTYAPFICLCVVFVALATYALCAISLGDRRAIRHLICIIAVIAMAGLCVNPVQRGISALQDNGTMQLAKSVSENDPQAVWAGDTSIPAQALLASGIRAINSVALYPDLDTWRKIDSEGALEWAYNRYAHIAMEPTKEETSFVLESPDTLIVRINADDIPKLGINYWLSKKDLESYNTNRVRFVQMGSHKSWSIFKIEYEDSAYHDAT